MAISKVRLLLPTPPSVSERQVHCADPPAQTSLTPCTRPSPSGTQTPRQRACVVGARGPVSPGAGRSAGPTPSRPAPPRKATVPRFRVHSRTTGGRQHGQPATGPPPLPSPPLTHLSECLWGRPDFSLSVLRNPQATRSFPGPRLRPTHLGQMIEQVTVSKKN